MRNTYKILGIVFGIMAFGALSELSRILTSSAPDIVQYRGQLIIMGVVMESLFIFLAWLFWTKYKKAPRPLK